MFIRLRVGGRCQWDTYYTSRPGTTRPLRALARLSHGLGRRLGPDSISPALAAALLVSGRQATGLQVKPRAGTMIPLLAGHVSGANMRRERQLETSWHEPESGWAASRSSRV